MKVPFDLRRRREGRPATALLLPSGDAAALLGLCARLGLDPSGRIHAVEGGFLVKLDAPTDRPLPGAIRLHGLAANLFLPADAELVPALLDDEATGLVRDRGLIFLPGGRVLGFDPRAPLDPSALLVAEVRPRRAWGPLPDRERIAERIEAIVVDRPDESPEAVLDSDPLPIGTEEPRPEDSGAASKLLGKAALGAGRGMVRLGRMLGLEALAGLGARWIDRAVALVPRLNEDLLGRQAAALRDLLREFREGDLERALRRALPLGAPGGDRGAGTFAGDRLPPRDLSYALNDLLGRQPSSLWLGGQDVMAELTREYRKAAEQALRQGDYRRAASIYGKLLRDFRAAANALLRGGLHHDAAILMLAKLDDPLGAARAFEAAGEVDRAVQLYRQVGQHELAGDLLRRIGEEDAALDEYRRAADRLIATGAGHLAAGDLLLNKAGRADLALEHFAAGWAARPAGNAIPCAHRLARLHAERPDAPALLALLDEADGFFLPTSDHDHAAGAFFNDVAQLADLEGLAPVRDELRDRALRALATKLRQHAQARGRAGTAVSTLLGRPGLWPAAVVSDADFAVKALDRRRREAPRPPSHPGSTRRFRVGVGLVSAVCAAPGSDEIFLGFEGGEVFCFRPERAEVVRVAAYDLPVAALAVDHDGLTVVVLRAAGGRLGTLSTYARHPDGSYRLLAGTALDVVDEPWLTPVLAGTGDDLVGFWSGRDLCFLAVATLNALGWIELAQADAAPTAARLVPWTWDRGAEGLEFAVLAHDGRQWGLVVPGSTIRHRTGLTWRPLLPETSALRSVPLSWAGGDPDHLEVAGLSAHGTLHWAAFCYDNGGLDLVASNLASDEGGYVATAIVRPNLVAGVTRTRIDWFRPGAARFAPRSATDVAIPSAVACFPSRRTGELIVVCDDGFITRVTIPS